MSNEHLEHLIRTGLIVAVCAAIGGVYVFASLDAHIKAQLEGAMAVMFPALVDALRVSKRQKTVRNSTRPPKP